MKKSLGRKKAQKTQKVEEEIWPQEAQKDTIEEQERKKKLVCWDSDEPAIDVSQRLTLVHLGFC